jgi:hypothetical protein
MKETREFGADTRISAQIGIEIGQIIRVYRELTQTKWFRDVLETNIQSGIYAVSVQGPYLTRVACAFFSDGRHLRTPTRWCGSTDSKLD